MENKRSNLGTDGPQKKQLAKLQAPKAMIPEAEDQAEKSCNYPNVKQTKKNET